MTSNTDSFYLDHYEPFGHVFDLHSNRQELDALSLIRIKLISLHHFRVGPDWNSEGTKRTSHFHHIHFVIDGSASVFHEGKTLTMTKGGVYWRPANCPVECACERSYEHYFLVFRIEWTNGRDFFIPERRPLRLGAWEAKDYVKQWRKSPLPLHAYWRLQAFVQKLLAESLDNLDVLVGDQYANQVRFQAVFNHINEHPGASIRVGDLARVHGLSSSTFSRNFTACFGIPPRQYLSARLNQQVIDILVGSDKAMSKIAEELGFTDEYYFNRFFSGMNGISPLKYRKKFSRTKVP